jgi:hypothetical protein
MKILVAAIVFLPILYFVLNQGGAKKTVSIIFNEYILLTKQCRKLESGHWLFKETILFENEKQLKLFILNAIFSTRISPQERSSIRFTSEMNDVGKIEEFHFKINGKDNVANLFAFENLGHLITTIWYIESGIRASYLFKEDFPFDDVYYDQFASKVISKEYNRLCRKLNIANDDL